MHAFAGIARLVGKNTVTYNTTVDAVFVVGNALRRHSTDDEVTPIVSPRRQTTEVHLWCTSRQIQTVTVKRN